MAASTGTLSCTTDAFVAVKSLSAVTRSNIRCPGALRDAPRIDTINQSQIAPSMHSLRYFFFIAVENRLVDGMDS